MIHDQTKKFEWDTPTEEHRVKSTDWFWMLGIIVVTGCVISIVSGNYLFAFLMILGGGLVAYHANDIVPSQHVEISVRGVKIDKNLYPHETNKSFWVYTDHKDRPVLLLITGRAIQSEMVLPLDETVDALALRAYLMTFLPEKETKPSTVMLLAEALGL